MTGNLEHWNTLAKLAPFKSILVNVLFIILIFACFCLFLYPIIALVVEPRQSLFFLPIPFLFTFGLLKSIAPLNLKAKIFIPISLCVISIFVFVKLSNVLHVNTLRNHLLYNEFKLIGTGIALEFFFFENNKVKIKDDDFQEVVFNYATTEGEILIYDDTNEMFINLSKCKIEDGNIICDAKFYDVDEKLSVKLIKK